MPFPFLGSGHTILQPSSFVGSAQIIRAVRGALEPVALHRSLFASLLASAAAATIFGLRITIITSQRFALPPFRTTQQMTFVARHARLRRFAPTISTRRMSDCPNPLTESLPRVERLVEPDSIACPVLRTCGDMVRIGEDRSERPDYIPARYQVIVTLRPRYACPKGRTGVVQAKAPAHLPEGRWPTEALLAQIAVSKHPEHMPLNRQAVVMARHGVLIDQSVLTDWIGRTGALIAPVVDHMAERVLPDSTRLCVDETTAPALDPDRGKTTTGYLWAVLRDDRGWNAPAPPGVVFHYRPGRKGESAAEILDGFNGTIQVGAYGAYTHLATPKKRTPIADEALLRIAALYKVEDAIRGSDPDHRRAVRQEMSRQLVDEFFTWLAAQAARVSYKSDLGEAMTHMLRRQDGFSVSGAYAAPPGPRSPSGFPASVPPGCRRRTGRRAQLLAAILRSIPSWTSAIASIRCAGYASVAFAAGARSSRGESSVRLSATAIPYSLLQRRGITAQCRRKSFPRQRAGPLVSCAGCYGVTGVRPRSWLLHLAKSTPGESAKRTGAAPPCDLPRLAPAVPGRRSERAVSPPLQNRDAQPVPASGGAASAAAEPCPPPHASQPGRACVAMRRVSP